MSITSADGRKCSYYLKNFKIEIYIMYHSMLSLTQDVLLISPIMICIMLCYPDSHHSLLSFFLFLINSSGGDDDDNGDDKNSNNNNITVLLLRS